MSLPRRRYILLFAIVAVIALHCSRPPECAAPFDELPRYCLD